MEDYFKMDNTDVLINNGWDITTQVVGTTDINCRWKTKIFLKTSDLTKLN